ncbi:MAG: LPXTG cell wall anchor domain-containing protein [Candidatus Bathyarchaeota archaeon]|nr:LPXTG cell wall anchor domain-containing protein [Candidatus Termiticorpusculum sp.]
MAVFVKPKFNQQQFLSKKTLTFISLLFIITLFSSPFTSEVSGVWLDVDVQVKTETALRKAIDTSGSDGCIIYVMESIFLKNPLEISDGKGIVLVSYEDGGVSLVGADGMDTIIVRSGGYLKLYGGIVVTHAKGATGRGVYVERGGEFDFYGGVISGNAADYGGGVYNEGIFYMYGGVGGWDGIISNNAAMENGGGVYNKGDLSVNSGGSRILDNTAVNKGGGVYSTVAFEMGKSVEFSLNTALSGEGHDVFVEEEDVFVEPMTGGEQSYLLPIAGAVAIAVVVGLFFYRLKKQKQKQSTTKIVNSAIV